METINGIVLKMLKEDKERGTVFMRVQYDSMGEVNWCKVSGFASGIKVGDWIVAEGTLTEDVYQGRTESKLSARSIRQDLPKTASGCTQLFKAVFSRETHGVTQRSIEKFVAQHGDMAARAAEASPELILQLSERPAEFREAILRDWGRRISGRRAISLMEESGVDKNAIKAVVSAFKDTAYDILKKNPYEAVKVPLVGFENADKVGQYIGVPPNDLRRLSAAVSDILTKSEGSTYSDLNAILQGLSSVDGITPEAASSFLQSRITAPSNTDSFLVASQNGELIVQPRDMFAAEAFIAKSIIGLLKSGRRISNQSARAIAARVVEKQETKSGKTFDQVQRDAVIMGVTEPISILTGGPGTGKTTITEMIVEAAALLGEKPIFLVAPTGKAAKRLSIASGVSASTLHDLLLAREETVTGRSVFGRNRDNPLPPGSFVIVDESSMQDVEMMAALLDAMPADGRLLLVGDYNQLDSIRNGRVLRDLLTARIGANKLIPATELVEVYRQGRNSKIATGAAEIRKGMVPYLDEKIRGGLIFYEVPRHEIVPKIERLVTGPIAKQLGYDPVMHVSVLSPQTRDTAGTWEINRRLSSILNRNGQHIAGIEHGVGDDRLMPLPRIGDRVMLTDNDKNKRVVNGDIGILRGAVDAKAGRKGKMLQIDLDCGRRVELPLNQWRSLLVTNASTIHKYQGSQQKVIVMPVTMAHKRMLDRSLLYTGWTRAEELLVLVGEREAIEYAVSVVKSDRRKTRLTDMLQHMAVKAGLGPAPSSAPSSPVKRPVVPFGRPSASPQLEPDSAQAASPAAPVQSRRMGIGRPPRSPAAATAVAEPEADVTQLPPQPPRRTSPFGRPGKSAAPAEETAEAESQLPTP